VNKPGPKVDPEKVAQVLFDAHALGDEAAAQTHNVSVRTVENYRAKYAGDPIVSGLFAQKKSELSRSWLAATDDARQKLLARVLALAAVSDDLRQVAGALKIVTDSNVAERVVNDGLGEPGPRVPAEAGRPATLADAAAGLSGGPGSVH
jgi:hypothetical protein